MYAITDVFSFIFIYSPFHFLSSYEGKICRGAIVLENLSLVYPDK